MIGISQGNHRILICGLGSIGRRYLRLIKAGYPEIPVAVVRSGRGEPCVEENLADSIFATLDEGLSWQPTGAILATPASQHMQQSLHLARYGMPLLIEKPIGTDWESRSQQEAIHSLSARVPILVGYVLRHDPCVTYIKQVIQERKLGQILEADFQCGSWLPSWRAGRDYRQCVSASRDLGGGVLLELSHEIDMACCLLGPIHLLSAFTLNTGILEIDVEDSALLIAQSEMSPRISIRLDFCTRPPRRVIRLRGEKGELTWDLVANEARLVIGEGRQDSSMSGLGVDARFARQISHFLACSSGQEKPICTAQDGFAVLDVVARARELAALSAC